jgi:opacity protein-like surface antigen
MLSTSGVTDAAAFGQARSRGLAGEGGVDVELTDSITVRAGLRYLRFTHDFDGSGDLAVALDQDIDQDVLAAADAYPGGHAQVALRF